MNWKSSLATIALAALSACGGEPINTPSGNPEAYLQNVNPSCVRAAMQSAAMSMGSMVRVSTDTMLVVGKPTTNPMALVLLGSQINPRAEERATVLYAVNGDSMHIAVQLAMVTNPGTGFESLIPTGNQTDARALTSLAEKIGARCRR